MVHDPILDLLQRLHASWTDIIGEYGVGWSTSDINLDNEVAQALLPSDAPRVYVAWKAPENRDGALVFASREAAERYVGDSEGWICATVVIK